MTTKAPLVTSENFGDLLVQSATEALEHARGERAAVRETTRTRVRARPAQTGEIAPPPAFPPERVRALRLRLNWPQDVFARALNVSDQTVRAWEQGVRRPSQAALRLLQIAETNPRAIKRAAHLAK